MAWYHIHPDHGYMYSWLIVNGYSDFGEVVTQFHDAGIKVFGWQFVYSASQYSGTGYSSEADVSNEILSIQGIDGLIINAETAYEGEGKGPIAEQYMQDIRAEHPSSFIAYSSFARITDAHEWFPWLEFGRYCDANMPQCYWAARYLTPEEEVQRMKEDFDYWHDVWEQGGHGDSVKPIVPVGQGGQIEIGRDIYAGEITRFCDKVCDYGYQGVSLYEYMIMDQTSWDEYASCWDESNSPLASASDISGQLSIMYPDTLYEVTAKYYDPDGRVNLDLLCLGLTHPSDTLLMGWSEDLKVPVEDSEHITYLDVVYTPITDSYEGYQLTWKFKLSGTWPEADHIYFSVYASDDDGMESGFDFDDTDASFVVIDPPEVTTNSASGVTTSSATLNGYLSDTGGESCVESRNYFVKKLHLNLW